MFTRKKFPILSASICTKLENMRQAMEVLTGNRIRFIDFDFNTGHGKVQVGSRKVERGIDVDMDPLLRNDLIIWKFSDAEDEYRSYFNLGGEVQVICDENPRMHGKYAVWMCGTSFIHRYEMPALPEVTETAARLGMPVNEYMDIQ